MKRGICLLLFAAACGSAMPAIAAHRSIIDLDELVPETALPLERIYLAAGVPAQPAQPGYFGYLGYLGYPGAGGGHGALDGAAWERSGGMHADPYAGGVGLVVGLVAAIGAPGPAPASEPGAVSLLGVVLAVLVLCCRRRGYVDASGRMWWSSWDNTAASTGLVR